MICEVVVRCAEHFVYLRSDVEILVFGDAGLCFGARVLLEVVVVEESTLMHETPAWTSERLIERTWYG